MALADAIIGISKQIISQRQLMTTEQATINVAIHPFIRALGYDTNNLQEVRPEYNADAKSSGNERVDYAIMRDGKPIIFIEAKAADVVLNANHWKQLHHYFNAEDARIGILTNGLEFRFYTDLKKDNIMDREPFLVLDLLDLDGSLIDELKLFTKAGFDRKGILSLARKLIVIRLLENERAQPSKALAELFARQVYSGRITGAVIEDFMPILRRAWRQFIDQQVAAKSQPATTAPSPVAEEKRPIKSSQPAKISAAGGGHGIPVAAVWRKRRFEAELHYDRSSWRKSRITFAGISAAPSKAALQAIRSITPGFKAVNGWDFWKLRDPINGKERHIGDLREDDALLRRVLGRD